MSRKHFPIERKRIRVCGHRGMVGSALTRRLRAQSCELHSAYYFPDDLAAAEPARSAPRPAVARHA
jgi:hypothetical protein